MTVVETSTQQRFEELSEQRYYTKTACQDPKSALLFKIGLLGDKYQTLIHHARPSSSLRIFESELLESTLTRMSPVCIPVIYIPAMALCITKSLAPNGPTLLSSIGLFFLGFTIWAHLEYCLHRFVFHMKTTTTVANTIHFLLHGIHHLSPSDPDRLVFPPSLGVPLTFALYCFGCWLFGPTHGPVAVAGGIFGYISYDMTHWYVHHCKPTTALGKWLKACHMMHHFRNDTVNYGISPGGKFLDVLFGTHCPPSSSLVKKAGASSLDSICLADSNSISKTPTKAFTADDDDIVVVGNKVDEKALNAPVLKAVATPIPPGMLPQRPETNVGLAILVVQLVSLAVLSIVSCRLCSPLPFGISASGIAFPPINFESPQTYFVNIDLTASPPLRPEWIGCLSLLPGIAYLIAVTVFERLGFDDGHQDQRPEAMAAVSSALLSQTFANALVSLAYHGGSFTILGVLRGMFVLDTIEYFVHRLMHDVRFLFENMHKEHHSLTATPYLALYNSSWEALPVGVLVFLGFLCARLSWTEFICVTTLANVKTVWDHCSRQRQHHHWLHHTYPRCNYEQPFCDFWDRLLGTRRWPRKQAP